MPVNGLDCSYFSLDECMWLDRDDCILKGNKCECPSNPLRGTICNMETNIPCSKFSLLTEVKCN